MAFISFLLLLLLVALSSGSITPPNPPQFVYRVDFREPELIFQTGMKSYGPCENVFYHVQGRNCKEKTSAFISTTSNEEKAADFGRRKLEEDRTKQSIYVYKIRADQRFYSADYSLMSAADIYLQAGNAKNSQKYRELAEQYRSQEEWFAYKEIPTDLIQQTTTYTRILLNLKNKGAVVPNSNRYVDANTFASQEPFRESNKGCTPEMWRSLKACLP